jgi:hypothetical protein
MSISSGQREAEKTAFRGQQQEQRAVQSMCDCDGAKQQECCCFGPSPVTPASGSSLLAQDFASSNCTSRRPTKRRLYKGELRQLQRRWYRQQLAKQLSNQRRNERMSVTEQSEATAPARTPQGGRVRSRWWGGCWCAWRAGSEGASERRGCGCGGSGGRPRRRRRGRGRG